MLFFSLFLACQQGQNTASDYVPGTIETNGAVIATVNGVQIKDGIVDVLLKDVPAEKQAEIKAGPNFSRMKDQLITSEILYQAAVKENIHKDADAQVVMAITEREVMTDFLIKKLAKAKMTDEYLKGWYDDHLVQFKKETAEVSLILLPSQEEADAVVAALDAGGDFAALAKEKSMDPTTKEKGGSMGEIEMNAIPPQVAIALNSVEEGKHTTAINMGGAFGILKYNNKKTAVTSFEDAKEQIKESAIQELSQEIIKEVKDKATVVLPNEPKAEEKSDAAEEKSEKKEDNHDGHNH